MSLNDLISKAIDYASANPAAAVAAVVIIMFLLFKKPKLLLVLIGLSVAAAGVMELFRRLSKTGLSEMVK